MIFDFYISILAFQIYLLQVERMMAKHFRSASSYIDLEL